MPITLYSTGATPASTSTRGVIPMTMLSRSWMHADHSGTPERFADRCAHINWRYGRFAFEVWAPARDWLGMLDEDGLLLPFHADIDACNELVRPHAKALAARSLVPEFVYFDMEHHPLWSRNNVRRDEAKLERWLDILESRFDVRIDAEALKTAAPRGPGDHVRLAKNDESAYIAFEQAWFEWYASQVRRGFLRVFEEELGARVVGINWMMSDDSDDYSPNVWTYSRPAITPGVNCPVVYQPNFEKTDSASSGFWRAPGMSVEEAIKDRVRRLLVPDHPEHQVIPVLRSDYYNDAVAQFILDTIEQHEVRCTRAVLWHTPSEQYSRKLGFDWDRMERGIGQWARAFGHEPADWPSR